MARRTKLTDIVSTRICQAIEAGATYDIAAQYGGVTRQTMSNWLIKGEQQTSGRYRTFFDAFKKAEARCFVSALAVVKKAASSGTWQAAAWLLERRATGYTKEERPEIYLSIETDSLNTKTIVKEYKNHLQPLIEGPVIDLDEE